MKLAPRDADAFLKQPDKQMRGVLLYGPDQGLVHERSRLIAAAILGKNSDPLNRVELSGDQVKADPALLRDELSALSLMGGRRIIIINDAGDKLAPLIAAAYEGLTTNTYLIVEAEELSPSAGLRQWFEKEKEFAAFACYRSEGRNLEGAIEQTLRAAGMHASPEAIRYLADNLGNDYGVTQSELQKLVLFMGKEKTVTLEMAIELTGHNAAFTMEDICHAVAGGNAPQAHTLLTQLLHEGVHAVAIIRTLMRHFQRLDVAQAHMQTGASAGEAVSALRPPVFFKYVPATTRELNQLNIRAITQIENLLLKAEKELKSSLLAPELLASQVVQQAARMAG